MRTLGREIKPYKEYAARGWQVRIVTFQREQAADYSLPAQLGLTWFPHRRLLPWLPILRRDLGNWADVIKTNQSLESWHYVRAARRWRKPILLRCGYVAGESLEQAQGLTSVVSRYQQKEGWAFGKADRVAVPTAELAAWVQERYELNRNRIQVIPNFVDTDLFRPHPTHTAQSRAVIAVGRLVAMKRFDMLIRACARAKVNRLTIVGDGPERASLQALAAESGMACEFPGQLPHEELPQLLNRHDVYAQVSEWEGHPKTLIEAMACARPCLVASRPGLASQIEHQHTGWIAQPDEESLVAALRTLFEDAELRGRLGASAQKHVAETMSFRVVFERELTILQALVAQGSSGCSNHSS
jgi:glycosyltransferase involved in cell wall biosynthesis